MQFSGGVLDTIQNIQTTSSPSFSNLLLGDASYFSTLNILNSSSVYTRIESENNALLITTGSTSSDYSMYLGADKTNGLSYIQSVQWGQAWTTLALNKRGGKVETSNNVLDDGSGKLGINMSTPAFPLNFSDDLGEKIALWGNSAGNIYGFGIQSFNYIK